MSEAEEGVLEDEDEKEDEVEHDQTGETPLGPASLVLLGDVELFLALLDALHGRVQVEVDAVQQAALFDDQPTHLLEQGVQTLHALCDLLDLPLPLGVQFPFQALLLAPYEAVGHRVAHTLLLLHLLQRHHVVLLQLGQFAGPVGQTHGQTLADVLLHLPVFSLGRHVLYFGQDALDALQDLHGLVEE